MIFGAKYRESIENIGAAQATPLEFNKGIPGLAMALLTFLVTGTASHNGLGGDGIDRYQIALDSDLIIDMTPSETRAMFEYLYSRMGGQVPATTAVAWDWPFYLLGLLAPMLNGGAAPVVGLPAGTDKLIRLQLNASSAIGTVKLGWAPSAGDVTHSPHIIGRLLSGMTAGANKDSRYEVSWQPIPTVGIIINGFNHIDRIRMYPADANGKTSELFDMLHDQILAVLDPYNVQTLTTPLFIPFDVPVIFAKDSYILFDTNAGYDGTERILPVQLVEEAKPKKA
jgi:hypothetical protein